MEDEILCKDKRQSYEKQAFFLFRLAMGVNIMAHGLVRISKLSSFSDWMTGLFAGSMIPHFAVSIFSYALPFLEFIIGTLLIIGLFTRYALIAGMLLMICLVLGSCLIENWEFAGTQMVYVLLYYILIKNADHDYISVDKLLNKN